jgi:hypothetical protein
MTTEQKLAVIEANITTEYDLRVAAKVAMLIQDYALAQALRQLHDTRYSKR